MIASNARAKTEIVDMIERILKSDKDLQEGLKFLTEQDSILSQAIDKEKKITLRKRSSGFSSLLKTIVSQQLSTAAAGKIWQRIVDNGLNNQKGILQVKAETLLSLGLSRQKCSYAYALASANLNYHSFREMNSDQVINQLIEIKGIGKWTAQIYCMFSLERANVFPAGDLALQEAVRILFKLKERPSEKEVESRAEHWAPWKSLAALVLWDFYGRERKRKGVLW